MKTAGIILIAFGGLSTIASIIITAKGHSVSFIGVSFVVLGAFLISRANKNKEEEEKKKEWAEGNPKENE